MNQGVSLPLKGELTLPILRCLRPKHMDAKIFEKCLARKKFRGSLIECHSLRYLMRLITLTQGFLGYIHLAYTKYALLERWFCKEYIKRQKCALRSVRKWVKPGYA